MNENETQNIVQYTTNVEETNQVNPDLLQNNLGNKNKGNAIGILVPIILIIAIIAAAVYYFGYYTSTEQFYKRLIGAGVEAIAISGDEEDYKTVKASVKFDMNFKSENEEIGSEVEDLINDLEVAIATQIDKEEEKIVFNIESEYDDEALLNLDLYSDVKNKSTYIYAKDFLDKYLEVELENEYYTELVDVFETEESNTANDKRVAKVFKTEFSKMIKSKYCSTEKESITINGEKVNATKRTIKMTYQQLVDELIEAFENLKEYEDVKDSHEFAEFVEDTKDELQEIIDGYEDTIIQVNIYTTGLLQKVVKVEVVILDEDEESVTLAFTQIEDKKYNIEMLSEEDILLNIVADMSKEEMIKLKIDIEELGELTLNIEYSGEYNTSIDEIDEDKSAKVEELTLEEQQTLMKNLEDSLIYSILQQLELVENNDTINSDTNINSASELKDNQIITYDDETLVTFGIPTGYTVSRISDNYQTLQKGNTGITIKSSYNDETEYYSLLKNGLNYYSEQSYYKNISLSEEMTMTLGNNTFYYAIEKITYVSGSYEKTYTTLYLWKKVSNNYILEIEIEEPSGLAQEELNQLLTIETANM